MTASFVPSDQDVRDAIRTELAANICVEAGAGTGKTTVLVDRIVEVLRTGHVLAEQLVVVTFTEKAAAELASRVRRGLEDAMRDEAVDTAERERLAVAIRSLNHAHIETIHAFAASLLRERPVEAGMDPGFKVLDELPAQLAFRGAWDEWITNEMATDPPPEALLTILNLGLDFRYVREAAERLNRHRQALPLRPHRAPAAHADAVIEVLRSAGAALSAMHPRMKDPADKAYVAIPAFVELCEAWLALSVDDGAFKRALATASWPDYNGAQRNWFDPADCRNTKSHMDRIEDAVGEYVMALRSAATGDLVRWLEGFVRFYTQQRRQDGTVDFDDLLICARDLVRDKPEVRRYFQEKYRCILVDEFQDTDPLQAETIVRLCAADGGEPDWRRARLRPGALFAVGDPKQSIYRFRRADITMYDDVKHSIFGGERAIVQNFRSAAPIIAWVNDVFGRMIAPQQGVQPAYKALEHHPAFEAGAVTLVRGTVPSTSKIADVRAAEAAALAALIAREVSAGAWQVRQEGGAPSRAATWRDVAVLIPSRTELFIYEDAFARQPIPYRHEGGRAFFARQEVRELIAVLRATDDPSDGIAAVAALRSSAFGCSDEDLFLHRRAGGTFDHAATKRTEIGPVVAGLEALRAFSAMRHDTSLPDLVRFVLDSTRLVEFAMMQPQGDQVAANLLKVIDQARAFTDAEGSGLRGFTRWLKDNVTRAADPRAGSGGDETDALVSEDTDDVVRILTIHAAKGLEFPVVVLANLSGERADMTNVIAVSASAAGASLHMKLGKKDDGFRTPGYDDADVLEKEHREAEEKRLLYVAATRARDRLIVPFFEKEATRAKRVEPPKSLSDWLRSAGANTGEATDASSLAAGTTELPIWRGSIGSAKPRDVERVTAGRDAWLTTHDSLVESGNTPLRIRTATSMKSEAEPPWASDEQVRRGRAADFGTAVHALLERVDLREYADLSERAHLIGTEFGMPERAEEIEHVARNALGSAVLNRACLSARVLREVAFTAPLPRDGHRDAGFAEGRIDLLFLEDGADGPGIVIVDFKTDNVSPREVGERTRSYRPQALVYAWAAAAATGLPVREVVFLFARLPRESPIAVDAAFAAEADLLMRAPEAV